MCEGFSWNYASLNSFAITTYPAVRLTTGQSKRPLSFTQVVFSGKLLHFLLWVYCQSVNGVWCTPKPSRSKLPHLWWQLCCSSRVLQRDQQCVLFTVCCYKCLSLLACSTPRCRLTADWAVTLFIMSEAVKALMFSFKRCCQKLSSPDVHSERGALQLLDRACWERTAGRKWV